MLGTFGTDECNVESNNDQDFFQFSVTDNFATNYSKWGKF